jgi:hypothetical protein
MLDNLGEWPTVECRECGDSFTDRGAGTGDRGLCGVCIAPQSDPEAEPEAELVKLTGYELLRQAGELIAALEDSGGALDEASEETLGAWFTACPDKIGAYWAVTQRLRSEAGFLKQQADKLTKRKRALQTAEQRIRGLAIELLKAHRDITGDDRIRRGEFSANLSTRNRLVVSNEAAILDVPEYTREVVSVDTIALKSAIEAGAEIEGAHLEPVVGMTWR